MLKFFQKPKQALPGHTLYCRSDCGACIEVRLSAWWNNLNLDVRNIRSNSNYEEELIREGGKKQVPCLRIDNVSGSTRWMYESREIIQYLKTQIR